MAYGSYARGSANWKPLMMGHVKTLVESEGWTTMENGYNDGTYTRWVFKSQSGSFYVLFYCLTSELNSNGYNFSGIRVIVCEDYDSATKEFIKPVVISTTSAFAPAADGSLGSTKYSISTFPSIGVPRISESSQIYNVTPHTWVINAFPNLLSLTFDGTGGNTNFGTFVAGEFVSLVNNANTNDPVCIGYFGIGQTQQNSFTLSGAGFTRSAMNGGQAAHIWGCASFPWINPTFHDHFTVLNVNRWDQYAGAVGPSLSPIALRRSNTSDINLYGSLRALVPKTLYGGTDGLLDDTITIGANAYVSGVSDRYWLRKG